MYTPYYKRKRKRKYHSKGKKLLKRTLITLTVLLAMVLIPTGVFQYLKAAGKDALKQNAKTASPDLQQSATIQKDQKPAQEYDPNYVKYGGKQYRYNQDIISILCMGIDKHEDTFEKQEISGKAGQADAIFLLVLDTAKKQVHIIAVSRDTMTLMRNFDAAGAETGKSENHLGLAFAYGDGQEKSCLLMEEAVSTLFFDLPIHGYGAILMNAIEPLNDAVGGVTVTVQEDLTNVDPAFIQGETVTLMGDQARRYVQYRDMDEDGSNQKRMSRQKQYILAFMDAALKAVKSNPTLVAGLYQELSSQMVTNIGLEEAVYLASEMTSMNFSGSNIHNVEGEIRQGKVYEEFYADDEKLLKLVLDVFYNEIKE